MRYYLKQNCYDAAVERINYLFDEFPNVVLGFSGGKDSTVILNITLKIAEERNRLPLKVLWIDQEAEWQSTVDYATRVMENPKVEPIWFQMPMVITNNASSTNRYSYCWNPEEKDDWIHEQHPLSKKENIYGTNRFHDLFEKILKVEYPNIKTCYIAGVRAEESHVRRMAVASGITYKDITWGKVLSKKHEHYTFYPIYDWCFRSVWKYIYENNIDYNKVYDEYYRLGIQIAQMRVSNLHHETAIKSLLNVQQIEPATWNKLAKRIDGATAIKHLKTDSFRPPKELPYMFNNWLEYCDHLIDNMVPEEQYKLAIKKKIEKYKVIFDGTLLHEYFYKKIVNTILTADWDFTMFSNWLTHNEIYSFVQLKKNPFGLNKTYRWTRGMLDSHRYLTPDEKNRVKEFFNK